MSSVKLQYLSFFRCVLLESYNKSNGKGTDAPDRTIKAYSGSRRTFACVLNLSTSCQHHAPADLSSGKNIGTHRIGDWLGRRAFLDFWRRDKFLASAGTPASDCPGRSAVDIPVSV